MIITMYNCIPILYKHKRCPVYPKSPLLVYYNVCNLKTFLFSPTFELTLKTTGKTVITVPRRDQISSGGESAIIGPYVIDSNSKYLACIGMKDFSLGFAVKDIFLDQRSLRNEVSITRETHLEICFTTLNLFEDKSQSLSLVYFLVHNLVEI